MALYLLLFAVVLVMVGVVAYVTMRCVLWLLRQDENLKKSRSYTAKNISFRIFRNKLCFRESLTPNPRTLKPSDYYPSFFHKPNFCSTGSITIPSLGLTHEFSYTTDAIGRRVTSSNTVSGVGGPAVAIFGCSFTWGCGSKDEDTFAWKLQKLLPNKTIHNYGVDSFSLYEIFLLLQNVLKTELPETVVIVYHYGLEGRSTALYPDFAWSVAPRCWALKIPFISKDFVIRLSPQRLAHKIVRIRHKLLRAFFHYLLSLKLWPNNRKSVITRTTRYLIRKIKELCDFHGVKLFFYCINSSPSLFDFYKRNMIPYYVFSPPEPIWTEGFIQRYTLFPFDPHFNEAAQDIMAKELSLAISELDSGKLTSSINHTRCNEELGDIFYPLF